MTVSGTSTLVTGLCGFSSNTTVTVFPYCLKTLNSKMLEGLSVQGEPVIKLTMYSVYNPDLPPGQLE